MHSIELKLTEEEFKQVEEVSRFLNLSLEELLKGSVESTIAITKVIGKKLPQVYKDQITSEFKSSSTTRKI
ncbi:MAG: hypothetical protein ACXAEU_23780 [Candidatus Hodarchaeales archaeon]|jgi:hypothetical protein